MFELKPSAAAQTRGRKLESKINIYLFQIPFRQHGTFYKRIKKSEETKRICKKFTAVFCTQNAMNAPSIHIYNPHSSLDLHTGFFTNHPAIITSDNVAPP
jgi:hypothetical protein